MIAVIWRAPRAEQDNDLYERFTRTPGLVSSYRLANERELVVVSIWESAERRDEYVQSSLQAEIIAASPTATREVFEVLP